MGTPDFAVGVLSKLVENNYNVIGVITAVDKPAGRGNKLRQSAVKQYAISKELLLFQPPNLKDIDFVESLKKLQADLFIVVAFRMLPKIVWNLPSIGTFNLHASLLPAYRGAAPINWAIINGEKETGVTTFFIDDKIDTGAVILQDKVEILACDTAGILHDKLQEKGADLVLTTLDLIATGTYKIHKQEEKSVSKAPKLFKENTQIDWNASIKRIYDKIRGLSPYPAAWTRFISSGVEYTMKMYISVPEYRTHSEKNGKILIENRKIKIAVKEGFIVLEQLQLSGKKRMDAKSLLNGFSFSEDAHCINSDLM
jgi:methionyl-tRNA formyltransferase